MAPQRSIPEALAQGCTLSFEFFPPKTDTAAATLRATLQELEALAPDFISVTYGAGGSTRERTHEIVRDVRMTTSMLPMAHLTCVGHRKDELVAILSRYQSIDVTHILALRGDPPVGEVLPSELDHASDLMELIRSTGEFTVGVAAHPEGHPESSSRSSDLDHQAVKISNADFAITQLFFDVQVYIDFAQEMRARGVTTPIIPGIMPVTNLAQVTRMAELSGAVFPATLESRLKEASDEDGGVAREGIAAAVELCEGLLAAGAPGLHFYTLNKSQATREIASRLDVFADRFTA